eukprot:3932997-Rhodomonas_salina.2
MLGTDARDATQPQALLTIVTCGLGCCGTIAGALHDGDVAGYAPHSKTNSGLPSTVCTRIAFDFAGCCVRVRSAMSGTAIGYAGTTVAMVVLRLGMLDLGTAHRPAHVHHCTAARG